MKGVKGFENIWSEGGGEVEGNWRHLFNKELHYFYSSSYITKLFKSRRMRWVGHLVTCER
jgi:hypothetical protein